jgi:hypothetical protein
MTSFTDYLNSDYLGAYATLLPKSAPKSVVVYVESEEDIAFWRTILHPYETKEIKFKINLPSNSSLVKGKTKALSRSNDIIELEKGVGKFLLICVDSDYDYLLHGHYQTEAKIEIDRKINESIYIFQTYTYSIENLKCYAESLHSVCVATTFNDEQKIDFEAFMKVYSTIIYELFLWNLLFYSKGEDDSFTLTSFCDTIKILEVIDIGEHGKTALGKVQERVKQKIIELETNFPHYKDEISDFDNKLKQLGLDRHNTYLFVQGHTIFNNVVLMLLKPLCNLLRDENRAKIKEVAKNKAQEKDELKNYQNKVENLKPETILSANTEFKNCFLFSKIKQDIQRYIVELQ